MFRIVKRLIIALSLISPSAYAQHKQLLDPNKYGDVGGSPQQTANKPEINSDQIELRNLYSLEAANRYCGTDPKWTQKDQRDLILLIEIYRKRIDSKESDKIQRQADINYENLRFNSRRCVAQVKNLFADFVILKSKMLSPFDKAPEMSSNKVMNSNSNPPGHLNEFNSIFPNGIFTKTERDCARYLVSPKEMLRDERFERVTIEGREISRYSTGGCTVRDMAGSGPSYWILADCTEEGQTSKQKYLFSTRDGKFNFGQFDELGKTWWNFCGPNKISSLNSTVTSQTSISKQVTTGARCGSSAIITAINGVNGRNAKFNAVVTKEIAEEACSCNAPGGVLKGQSLQACVRDVLKNTSSMEAQADCQLRSIRDTNGNVRMVTGKIVDGDVELVNVSTREQVEPASYTGYHATINQLSILCPAQLCLSSVPNSEQLDGCKK
jgi:hypothetical protein